MNKIANISRGQVQDGLPVHDQQPSIEAKLPEVFEEDVKERIGGILKKFAENFFTKKDCILTNYNSALAFYLKDEYSINYYNEIYYNENPSYSNYDKINDIIFVVDNGVGNFNPIYCLEEMLEIIMYGISSQSDANMKALICYGLGRFIVEINGRPPLKCPQEYQEQFFRHLSGLCDNLCNDANVRGVLRELLTYATLHCEMPMERRNDVVDDLYREHILEASQSDPVKKTILSTFAAIGEGYRPIFGEEKEAMKFVERVRGLLVYSIAGIKSEGLLLHWKGLMENLIQLVQSGNVSDENFKELVRLSQKQLPKDHPPYVLATLEKLIHAKD